MMATPTFSWLRRRTSFVAVGCLLVSAPFPALADHPAIQRAESAIEAGDVDPERDIAPLLEALRTATTADEKDDLVDAIADLGEWDGDSPNSVKQYLIEHSPPYLFEVIEHGNDPFLQGDAVTALRGMKAPKAVLERAADLAEADPNEFVQSRGEILRNFIASMPDEDPASVEIHPTDPDAAREGIAYLDRRGITVSTEALREAAGRADPDSVRALLAAGVPVDTGVSDLGETPLGRAVSHACTSQGSETDWLVETVQLIVDAGADLQREDDGGNTALNLAVHWCGPRVTALLAAAGAELGHQNGAGLSALALALVTQKLDAAEVLVDAGARLTGGEADMVRSVATEGRALELFRRASQ